MRAVYYVRMEYSVFTVLVSWDLRYMMSGTRYSYEYNYQVGTYPGDPEINKIITDREPSEKIFVVREDQTL